VMSILSCDAYLRLPYPRCPGPQCLAERQALYIAAPRVGRRRLPTAEVSARRVVSRSLPRRLLAPGVRAPPLSRGVAAPDADIARARQRCAHHWLHLCRHYGYRCVRGSQPGDNHR
jgi:hypothetical protein